MNTLARLAVSLALLGLSGCANYYAMRWDTAELVDQWVAQQEYGKALETLHNVSPSRKDYPQLRAKLAEVTVKAKRYEEAVIAKSNALQESRHWADADQTYRIALDHLPDSPALNAAYRAFTARRAAELAQLRTQLLLNEGRALAAARPVHNEIQSILPEDADAAQRVTEDAARSETLARQLKRAGEQALSANDLPLAEATLTLARTLHPTPALQPALDRLAAAQARQLKEEERKRQHEHQAERERQAGAALKRFKKCYRTQDWLCARDALQEVAKLQPDHRELPALQQKLKQRTDTQIKQGMEQGRRLYSQGNIQGALDTWKALQPLDPDNPDLAAHIVRAQRVLEKMQELSDKPPTSAPH